MKTYILKNKGGNYKTIDTREHELASIIEHAEWNRLSEIDGKSFHWLGDGIIPDCPFIIGAIPVIKTSLIDNVAFSGEARTVQIDIEGSSYTIILAEQKGGLLDESSSEIKRFKSGRIMRISRYVLQKHNFSLFRLQEYPLFTFVSDGIYESLYHLPTNEIIFEECNIAR